MMTSRKFKAEPKSTIVFSESEEDEPSIIDNKLNNEIAFRVQETNNPDLRAFKEFLNNPDFIKNKGDKLTNIVDRHNIVNSTITSSCYAIPDDKIPKFFKFLDHCRRKNLKMVMFEKQGEVSGMMIDIDIYQSHGVRQFNFRTFKRCALKLTRFLGKYLEHGEPGKSETIHMAFIVKPKPVFDDAKGAFKDGFHMLIPGIQLDRPTKKMLIDKLAEENQMDEWLCDIIPAEGHTLGSFLDKNSAHVPCHFLGSSSRVERPCYILDSIVEITMPYGTFENVSDLDYEDILPKMMLKDEEKPYILCHELSLNWERAESKGGLIRKKQYFLREIYQNQLVRYRALEPASEVESAPEEHGELSILRMHDPDVEYIKSLLDTLNPQRAVEYKAWFQILCVLANTSKSYKPLAEYFSMKSDKYNKADFDKYWQMAQKGTGYRLGSLHHWAEIDNPDRYRELRARSMQNLINKKVYEIQIEGQMQHYDVAQILYQSLSHKYAYDGDNGGEWYEFILDGEPQKKGQIYKWVLSQHKIPNSLKRYMSEILSLIFVKVLDRVKKTYDEAIGDLSQYHYLVYNNFKISARRLRDAGFKNGTANECEQVFEKKSFSEQLDKDPDILGVGNGILKLGKRIEFITGYHTYLVSKYTPVSFKEFNPYDPLTQKLLISLRNLFPDDESDTFNFMMHYLASMLDGHKKESLILLLVGNGANGKSFLVEMHKAALGSAYAVKMPLAFLTSRQKDSESATPALMGLMDARFAYYSETNQCQALNSAKLKEVTGQETLGGRKNYGDYINFKPKCHHMVTSNYDFEVSSSDHGTWRRIKRVSMKIKFCKPNVDDYDEKNPYERICDPAMGKDWPDDEDVQTAYLGIMAYYYESLQINYEGVVENVPHPHIKQETDAFRNRQDKINNFISIKVVKTVDITVELNIQTIIEKYIRWYDSLYPDQRDYKRGLQQQMENSILSKIITKTRDGPIMLGYRVLDHNEKPAEGEQYFVDLIQGNKKVGNIAIQPESASQFYKRICLEYDAKVKAVKKPEVPVLKKVEYQPIIDVKKEVVSKTTTQSYDKMGLREVEPILNYTEEYEYETASEDEDAGETDDKEYEDDEMALLDAMF